MRVVVVGASGNVGSATVAALLADPAVESVLGVARRLPEGPGDPRLSWLSCDLAAETATDTLTAAFRGADAVVHLAWVLQPGHDVATLERINVGGTRRVLAATTAAGVPALVVASSIGAYSPGPKDRRVTEEHPTGGVAGSSYSRQKVAVERLLDAAEAEHPDLRVVRIRPGLVFQRQAASEITRYFLGTLVPTRLVRGVLHTVVPAHPRLVVQAEHASDVGAAFAAAAVRDVRGAFNIAAEPALDPPALAAALGARAVPVPALLLRGAAAATFLVRLQPTEPGWIDLALAAPVMDTGRARRELGWQPRVGADEALRELVDAMGEQEGGGTPALRGLGGLRGQVADVARNVGDTLARTARRAR